MYLILLLILSIILFTFFWVFKKNYQRKEIFLLNSIDQLRLEKKMLEKDLKEKEESVFHLEKELLETRKINLELSEHLGRLEEENQALRNLVEGLQKKQESKNEDIVVEYIFKP